MNTTSMTAPMHVSSWKRGPMAAVILLLFVACSFAAYGIGRATAHRTVASAPALSAPTALPLAGCQVVTRHAC